MTAKTRESSRDFSPVKQLAGWARQGIESFVAAQKILLDLTAQQNALAIGMVREHLGKPLFRPGETMAQFADKGVENVTTAGKILLDLAAGETQLVMDGVKEELRLPVPAAALTEVVRHRVDTLIGWQKRLLEAAAEQTHEVAESYRKGDVWKASASVAELARKGIESFVETEKKFLDLAAHEVTVAIKGGKEAHKPARDGTKALAHLAREGVEKFIEAQKKLLDLAIEQMESMGEAANGRSEAVRKELRTSWGELTEKSVHNLVKAQKSLIDLAKPGHESAREETPKAPRGRPRHKRAHVETAA
jgi:hypothetical protein